MGGQACSQTSANSRSLLSLQPSWDAVSLSGDLGCHPSRWQEGWGLQGEGPEGPRGLKDSASRTAPAPAAQGWRGQDPLLTSCPSAQGAPHGTPLTRPQGSGRSPGRVGSRRQVAGPAPRTLGTWRICSQGHAVPLASPWPPHSFRLAWPLATCPPLARACGCTHWPLHCGFWSGSCRGPCVGRKRGLSAGTVLRVRWLPMGCGRPAAQASPRPRLSALTAGLAGHLQTASAAPWTRAACCPQAHTPGTKTVGPPLP